MTVVGEKVNSELFWRVGDEGGQAHGSVAKDTPVESSSRITDLSPSKKTKRHLKAAQQCCDTSFEEYPEIYTRALRTVVFIARDPCLDISLAYYFNEMQRGLSSDSNRRPVYNRNALQHIPRR